MPKATYRRENASLRDAAHPLSARRDASILLETLAPLTTGENAASMRRAARATRAALKLDRERIGRATAATSKTMRAVRAALSKQKTRLQRLRIDPHGWSVVGSGVRRTYARGRRACREAKERPSVANLHEWRKQVKYSWHQLQLLEKLWPSMLGELADQAHKLSDYLGDDHDLAVLREAVMKNAHSDTSGRDSLTAAIDERRARLQGKAFTLGARLYDENASAFTARLKDYWRLWVHAKAAH
jgi:CHAD domain-containing protein